MAVVYTGNWVILNALKGQVLRPGHFVIGLTDYVAIVASALRNSVGTRCGLTLFIRVCCRP
jgi:hypothetical protein